MQTVWIASIASLFIAACATPSTTLQNASGQAATCKSAGWGFIGTPLALASHAECVEKMQLQGYRAVGDNSIAPKAISSGENVSLNLATGWEKRDPPTEALKNGYFAVNVSKDIAAWTSAVSRKDVDLMVYATSRRLNQENLLTNPKSSEISTFDLDGKLALRFWTKGNTRNGTPMVYLYTIVEGTAKIAVINTWTAERAFDFNRPEMEDLATRIVGLN
ncbi:MAG: hypothetical protein JNM61_02275 [Zoogloeaceae bacterium]|nr:hypothetical protein [Zoogloeaceae bacterium]